MSRTRSGTRFRAAQEKFFSRRNKTFSERDAEFEANAAVKERLLAEAEKIDPSRGLERAKATLRSIQERWEAAGKVPRERIREFDGRLRAVEDQRQVRGGAALAAHRPGDSRRGVEQFRSRVEQYRAQAAKAQRGRRRAQGREADGAGRAVGELAAGRARSASTAERPPATDRAVSRAALITRSQPGAGTSLTARGRPTPERRHPEPDPWRPDDGTAFVRSPARVRRWVDQRTVGDQVMRRCRR